LLDERFTLEVPADAFLAAVLEDVFLAVAGLADPLLALEAFADARLAFAVLAELLRAFPALADVLLGVALVDRPFAVPAPALGLAPPALGVFVDFEALIGLEDLPALPVSGFFALKIAPSSSYEQLATSPMTTDYGPSYCWLLSVVNIASLLDPLLHVLPFPP
jgi:hypothetical protein